MVILVMGLPGSGKTFFASRLAEKLDAVHLNSDSIRREMGKWSRYSDSAKRSVYDEMLRRTQEEISAGKEVVADATFFKKEFRDKFLDAMRQMRQQFRLIEVRASDETIRQRLSRPRADSEADYRVYKLIKSQAEPVTEEHLVLFSDRESAEEMIKKALEYIGQP